jgi:dihydrofolate reductase
MPGEGTATASRVTMHMVASVDGFIAKHDNDVSWLNVESPYAAGVSISADEAAAFVKAIDCYILGSRTYEHALELGWVYGDTPVVVVTSRQLPSTRTSVDFYSGDLTTLVKAQLAPRYRNIWLVGGADLSQRFFALGLIDDIRLTVAPVLLGDGLRLFGGEEMEQRLTLVNVTPYKNGYIELSYSVAGKEPAGQRV